MEDVHADAVHEYTEDFKVLCASKAEEFHLLGYEGATSLEIWQCVQKLTKGHGQLHQVVQAILGLNIGRFMTYTTINAYQGKFGEDV